MLPLQWMTDAGGESTGRGSPLCSGSSGTTDVGGESVGRGSPLCSGSSGTTDVGGESMGRGSGRSTRHLRQPQDGLLSGVVIGWDGGATEMVILHSQERHPQQNAATPM